MKILKPPRLRRGDIIGLIAPASPPLDGAGIERGIRYLESLGYRTCIGAHALQQHGYLAGTDTQRAADINSFLRDPKIRAIMPLRGGYGTPRLLPLIDYAAARRDPKIIVGYSDITALQLALWRRSGLVTFAGPMLCSDLADGRDAFTEENFWRLLTSNKRAGDLTFPARSSVVTRNPGCAEGHLLGTNLSLLVSCLGTPFTPNYQDALLILEDVGEQLHRIDRMLTQLRNAGILRRINGLILGAFTLCSPSHPKRPFLSLEAIINDLFSWFDQPAIEGFPFGHIAAKLTIPLGCRARLHATKQRLQLLESAVS